MPNNSNNSINSFSPNFRDALLGRNLLADSVKDNSLSSLLDSINKTVDIGDGVGMVKGSPDIETDGPIYRTDLTNRSKVELNNGDYLIGAPIPYISRDLNFIPSAQYTTAPVASPNNDGIYWRDTQNTVFNLFKFGNKEYYGNGIIQYDDANIITNTRLVDDNTISSPETDAEFRRELSITQNQYKSPTYRRVDFVSLPFETNPMLATLNLNPNVYAPTLETYTSIGVPATGSFQGGDIRQFNTAKNIYLDVPKQTRTIINTDPVPTQQVTSYIDYLNGFDAGGAQTTQLINVLGSALGGNGVGFDPNSGSLVPDFDVRSSLAGRALTSAGALDDTRLGQISPGYLAAAIGNNIAFNLQEETIGRINTNPLSIAMGGDLIVPSYKITVRDGILGGAADIIERMTGAKIPVSLLPESADIFSHSKKAFIGIPNIARANAMLTNTGRGQTQALFGNINSNTNVNLISNPNGPFIRGGYAPLYLSDGDSNEIANIYAYEGGATDSVTGEFVGDGSVLDVLNGSTENSPVAKSSYNLNGIVRNSGFNDDPTIHWAYTTDFSVSKFIWGDKKFNKLSQEKFSTNTFKVKKSLLYKTQELFNSNNMRTLVSGKGINATSDEITTAPRGFMSKGSGVLKNGGNGIEADASPDDVFVRAWSTMESYNQYKDLQKHSALSNEGRVYKSDVESSVLGPNGMVRIAPYKGDKIKKFMFSIENLAWAGETTKLLECEIGNGDPLSPGDTKGRIMWFPPYDMVINESTSASWDRSNFIGRGEPVYTYNNTERTGTLSWKIVVDHPNYFNYMKDKTNDEISAFFAGALSMEEIRNSVLSADEKAKYELAKNKKQQQGVPDKTTPNFNFDVYFPNDDSQVPVLYESGLNTDTGKVIDYSLHPTGIVYKLNTTTVEAYYGEGTTSGEGIVGTKGRPYVDNTNFGLNGIGNKIRVPEFGLPGEDAAIVDGWYELDGGIDIYFTKGNCKYCKFEITGYASPQGDATRNKTLAKSRADNLKKYIVETGFLSSLPIDEANARITTKSVGLTSTGCNNNSSQDTIQCKKDRRATVRVKYDPSLALKDKPRVTKRDSNEPDPNFTIPLSRFYTECDYFEAVEENDTFATSRIKEKIKNFSPAFHAITPEGFNSRLTFLQQCMRQGPTTSGKQPDNLAFGKPPVCILRIGDFYHTKIIIESLTIDYEPLVWDLNPEGVGVQPMIANVNISFAFIGGSSMKGPINRLQNAVSFNYFANTEIYDPRAERIRTKETPEKDKASAEIVPGSFPFSKEVLKRLEAEKIDDGERAEFEAKSLAEEESRIADISAEEAQLAALTNDKEILSLLRIEYYKNNGEFVGFDLEIGITTSDKIISPTLTQEYSGELYIVDVKTSQLTTVGFLRAIPIDDTSFSIEAQSPDGALSETTFYIKADPTNVGLVNFSLFDHPDFAKIMTLLEPCGETQTIIFDGIEQEVFVPCDYGDNILTMKWTNGSGFNAANRAVYNNTENDK